MPFRNLVFLFAAFFMFNALDAQVTINKIKNLETLKKGTTYVVADNYDSEEVKAYMDVFKKYWTLTDVEFIRSSELKTVLKPNNTFFTILKVESYPGNTVLIDYHLYLCEPKKKLIKSKNPEIKFWNVKRLANYYIGNDEMKLDTLFYKKGELNYIQRIYSNFTPGTLKNALQYMSFHIDEGAKFSLKESHENADKLSELKSKVLYIPKSIFFGDINYTEERMSKILASYAHKYEIIEDKKLEEKILAGEDINYLLETYTNVGQYLSVVNAKNGDFIYKSRAVRVYRFTEKTMKKLSDAIGQ